MGAVRNESPVDHRRCCIADHHGRRLGLQLGLAMSFLMGMLIGVGLGFLIGCVFCSWLENRDGPQAKRALRKTYPRKTTMPKYDTRVAGKPTNIGEPPATVRQVQFRARRETKD